MKTLLRFVKAYVRSMRLYYSFITGIAGWVGVAYYQHVAHAAGFIGTSQVTRTVETPTPPEKKLVILAILFLSWGVNQIINDYLGLETDRLNAPDRPMVTGELHARAAVGLSIALMLLAGAVTAVWLQPIAVLPLAAGVVLNVIYEEAKGHGLLGNLVFGVMITMCGLYGFCASGPTDVVFTGSRLSVLFLMVVLNGLMTFYTYFKDADGDAATGKRTLVVQYGPQSSRWIALGSSLLPASLFALLYFALGAIEIELNRVFVILGGLTAFLQIWTGVLYFLAPVGPQTYRSLEVNFRAGACGQAALVALFNPELGMMLFMFAYIFVGFLFSMHGNARA